MAKDRMTIFIPNMKEDSLCVDKKTWIHVKYRGHWSIKSVDKMEMNHPRRLSKYRCGTMSCKAGFIDVEFLKYSSECGDLLLSFSVSELYFFNNSKPKSFVDPDDLARRMLSDLRYVIDTTQLPSIDEWKITRDETNLDIIDSQENLDRRFLVLSKGNMPYRKVDEEFYERGSIYYFGRAGKKSASKFIIYDKLKEQKERKGEDLRKVLNLNSTQGVLRLESKIEKDTLKRYLETTKGHTSLCDYDLSSSLSVVLSGQFQFRVMMDAISQLNLDKIITTRSKLIRIINNCDKLTKVTKANALKVIKQVNGERHSQEMHEQTVKKYSKVIFSMGYHVLYSDVELKPITEDMVLDAVSSDLKQIRLDV